MKKLWVVAASVLLLASCGENKDSAPATPADCQEYTKTLQAMIEKSPAAAEQFKKTLEDSKSQWAKMDKAQAEAAGAACKQANDALKAMMPK